MEAMRKPCQGVWNIVRFNWHYYAAAAVAIGAGVVAGRIIPEPYSYAVMFSCALALGVTLTSLLFSWYIYDLSDLYELEWLEGAAIPRQGAIVNIHAGFDETSELLRAKFPGAELHVFDFYDPEKHTEISVKRARRAYPPFAGTQHVSTAQLPLADGSADTIFLIFAAHEIRNEAERIAFFREAKRALKANGKIVVTEHLRDRPNFWAYTIGFFHFYSRAAWLRTFAGAGLKMTGEIKVNLFITTFILAKNGAES